MYSPILENRTLEEIEGKVWGEPEFGSHLVVAVHRLRRKTLKEFSNEDIRLCISQNFFLEYLVPLALVRLQKNVLATSEDTGTSLLLRVLEIEPEYWVQHQEHLNGLSKLITENLATIKNAVKLSDDFTIEDINAILANANKLFGINL